MGGSYRCIPLLLALVLSCSSCVLLCKSRAEAYCSSDVGGAMTCRSLLEVVAGDDMVQQVMGNATVAVPSEIAVPAGSTRFLGAFRAVGYQHYRYNGSAWVLYNATAWLYESAAGPATSNASEVMMPVAIGSQVVLGVHFFLAQPDRKGGQPSWRLGTSTVTTKGVAVVTVDSDSITWNLLQATSYQLVVSHSAASNGMAAIDWVGDVSYVQRLQTQRGLAPPISNSSAAGVGDTFASVYAALYAFYSNSTLA